jgi:hypothetical protein
MWRFSKSPPETTPCAEPSRDLVCSFCGKNQREVRKLIAGPKVYICDECIDLCNDIIAEECDHDTNLTASESGTEEPADQPTCAICSKPREPGEMLHLPANASLCAVCLEAIEKLIAATDKDDVQS